MERLFYLLLLMMASVAAHADLVVIVGTANKAEHLSHSEIVNIFMGRYRKFPDGTNAQPLDIYGDAPERREFYLKLLDKSLADLNAYWARLIFSGRTLPPATVQNQAEMLERIAEDPTAIGYIERRNLIPHVKVIYALPE